jgi:predicted component of type VI protein secretion system
MTVRKLVRVRQPETTKAYRLGKITPRNVNAADSLARKIKLLLKSDAAANFKELKAQLYWIADMAGKLGIADLADDAQTVSDETATIEQRVRAKHEAMIQAEVAKEIRKMLEEFNYNLKGLYSELAQAVSATPQQPIQRLGNVQPFNPEADYEE